MAVTTTNLGVITAYGDAVAAGYAGTKAEWQTLMASYATVGQQAVNAKNDAVGAKTAAQNAQTGAETAASNSEAYAIGKRNGTDVTSGDAAYHNNAKYYAEQAATSAASLTVDSAMSSSSTNPVQNKVINAEITELKEDLTQDLLKAFPTATVSGSVASFNDGANLPVKNLTVEIEPVQSGSGDPSPTNVRPITGWSAVNVQRTGKNLAYLEQGTLYFAHNGSEVDSTTRVRTGFIPVKPNIDYIASSGGWVIKNGVAYDADKNYIGYGGAFYPNITTGEFRITDSRIKYVRFIYGNSENTDCTPSDMWYQFKKGTTATTYEPYSGQSINIQLGQTVYGGTLDVLTGVLTVDRARVDLGTLNWNYLASDVEFYATISDIKPSTQNLVCDRYIVGGANIDKSILCVSRVLRLYDSAYTSAATLKASLTDAYLVYEVDTPLTIQLTPHEVTALLGSNNIWADTGDITVEYRADPTLYINNVIASLS